MVSVHGGEEQLCVLMASTKAHTLPKRLSYVLDKVHLEDIQGNKYQVRGFLRALQVVKTPGRFLPTKGFTCGLLSSHGPFPGYRHIPSSG